MGERTWKIEELRGLLAAFCATGFGDVGERARLRVELEGEIEGLVRQVYAALDELQRKKYYCARFAWRHRHEKTPGARKDGGGKPIGPVPWPQWFAEMFHDDLDRYMAECKERDTLKTVYEYEMAQFGKSSLEDDIRRREQRRVAA